MVLDLYEDWRSLQVFAHFLCCVVWVWVWIWIWVWVRVWVWVHIATATLDVPEPCLILEIISIYLFPILFCLIWFPASTQAALDQRARLEELRKGARAQFAVVSRRCRS